MVGFPEEQDGLLNTPNMGRHGSTSSVYLPPGPGQKCHSVSDTTARIAPTPAVPINYSQPPLASVLAFSCAWCYLSLRNDQGTQLTLRVTLSQEHPCSLAKLGHARGLASWTSVGLGRAGAQRTSAWPVRVGTGQDTRRHGLSPKKQKPANTIRELLRKGARSCF